MKPLHKQLVRDEIWNKLGGESWFHLKGLLKSALKDQLWYHIRSELNDQLERELGNEIFAR
jgi:hypothetical protein